MAERVIIVGAGGRDFHNFNTCFRDNPRYDVVAFTATQIPDIDNRRFAPELAGKLYPDGIGIHPMADLVKLIRQHKADLVVFAYSDVTYDQVMHVSALVASEGARFALLSAEETMLESIKPVISICAVRTGCGKSQTARKVFHILKEQGKKAVAVRHPMPYGDLEEQVVQRFDSYDDFAKHKCTIEEREEYEPLVDEGIVVYAGVDYEKILREAEKEADVVIWDGGNNDMPFYKPYVSIVVFDPHRAGHELLYYPSETNMLMADIALINKVDSATPEQIEIVRKNITANNPGAEIVLADSNIVVEEPSLIEGKRVLAVEDGPTVTHGGMPFGAATLAAKQYGASEVVDPHSCAVGSIADTLEKYGHVKRVLPAMGYSDKQVQELEATINSCDCDVVLFGTPIDLPALLSIDKPAVRVRYAYKDHEGGRSLKDALLARL